MGIVHVVMRDGERFTGESGGDRGDLSDRKSDAEIAEKFLGLTEEFLGIARAGGILERLWTLEKLDDVAVVPRDFARGEGGRTR